MKAIARTVTTAGAVLYSVILAAGFGIGAIAIGLPYALKLRKRPIEQNYDDSDYVAPWVPSRNSPVCDHETPR